MHRLSITRSKDSAVPFHKVSPLGCATGLYDNGIFHSDLQTLDSFARPQVRLIRQECSDHAKDSRPVTLQLCQERRYRCCNCTNSSVRFTARSRSEEACWSARSSMAPPSFKCLKQA